MRETAVVQRPFPLSLALGKKMSETIHPQTHIGAVTLTVADLSRSLDFYRRLGLHVHRQENGTAAKTAVLGAGENDLLVLYENPQARPVRGHTGLYHFAILVPSRLELAQALRNLAQQQFPVQGFSDHSVSEAIYLADPDGNGIEIYRDRPREEWQYPDGRLLINTMPLDLEDVMAELRHDDADWQRFSPDTTIGHIHLHVNSLADAETFYANALGFDLIARYGPSAMFVSAGGYHHHIGLNTWAGVNAPPPPPDSVGLRWYELILPDDAALQTAVRRLQSHHITITEQENGFFVCDPAQNGILLRTASK